MTVAAKAFDTGSGPTYIFRPMRWVEVVRRRGARAWMLGATMACLAFPLAIPSGAMAQEESSTAEDESGDSANSGDPSSGAPGGTEPSTPSPTEDTTSAERQRSDARRLDSDEFGGIVDATKVSIPEKKVIVERNLADQRDALARVTTLLQNASSAKDLVQRNCIDEKLTQIKGLLRISEEASVKMYEAIAANVDDLINHEFTKISVAHERSMRLRADAEQCVGETAVYSGETEVEVEIAPDVTQRDPTILPPPPPGPEYPAVASAF